MTEIKKTVEPDEIKPESGRPAKRPKRVVVLWVLLIFGFCAVEFPGILFVKDRVYPFVLGFPFLYGYVLCCWGYLCALLFYAFKTGWGKRPFISKGSD